MRILDKCRWIFIGLVLTWLKKLLGNRILPTASSTIRSGGNVNRVDYILDYCRDKSVLHIGFSDHPYTDKKIKDGTFLHFYLKQIAKNLWGLDNSEPAIETYCRLTNDQQVICADIMDERLSTKINHQFEVVLLGEIVEHLKNPHRAIENLHNTFSAGTILIVTTPNYSSINSFAAALNNTEMIHPDHYWYFSPVTFLKMFPPDKFVLLDINFGMYFQKGKKINFILRRFPFLGDCLIGAFKITKS